MRTTALIILLTTLAFLSCKKEYSRVDSVAKRNYKNVTVEKVENLQRVQPVVATGTLLSKEEITLSFKIGGIVANLNVEEGNTIKRGQRLGRLDLTEINAQVIGAKNSYDKSVRDLERATNLYRDTVGTLEQKQNAETAAEIARSNLNIAQFNQRFAVLNTPITGKVLKRFVEKGELVSPGQPIYRIGSSQTNGSQIVRLGLSDRDIVKIAMGDKAKVYFDAFEKMEFESVVTEISESSNPSTGLFEVELTLSDVVPELKNGFIGKVEIYPSSKTPLLSIPMDALVEGHEKEASIYYTQDGQTLKKAKVDVVEIKGDYFTTTLSQLPVDAKIITRGAPFLKVNDSINVVQ